MSELFEITHDGGDLSEYDATQTDSGDLSVEVGAALANSVEGMQCVIDDTNNILARKDATVSTSDLRFRFYFDPNGLSISASSGLVIQRLVTTGWGAHVHHVWIDSASYTIYHRSYIDAGTYSQSSAGNITDAPHYIEVHIERSSSDVAADGRSRMWIDGDLKVTHSGLDNYDIFGAIEYHILGSEFFYGTVSGTLFLDEYLANDDGSEIGSALTHYTITAAQGSYTYTGQTVSLLAARKIAAAQGSYTYTGQTVGLLAARTITAAQGSYTYTGQAVDLLRGFLITAAQGSYTYTGQAANLLRGYLIAMAQGSYTYTGQTTGLLIARLITAAQGSYALTGQATGLLIARLLTAAQGSYTLTGQTVNLNKGFMLAAAQGSYTLSGQAIAFVLTRVLVAAQGSYVLTGQAVDLTYSGVVVVTPDGRILVINAEDRSMAIVNEDRAMAINSDDRTLAVNE